MSPPQDLDESTDRNRSGAPSTSTRPEAGLAGGTDTPARTFLKSVSIIATGTAAGQIITVLCTPIITRLYSVEAFGEFGIFMVWVGLLGTACAGRYHMAVVLAHAEAEALNVLALSAVVSLAACAIVLSCLPVSVQICAWLGAPQLAPVFGWLAPIALFCCWHQAIADWANRHAAFAAIASASVAGAIVTNAWKVVGGLATPTVGVLVASTLAMFAAQFAVLLWRDIPALRTAGGRHVTPRGMLAAARKFWRLPVYRAPKDLLNGFAQNAPTLLLAYFFPPASVGAFVLVDRVLRAPGVLLGEAIRRVYFHSAMRQARSGEPLRTQFVRLTTGLAFTTALPFVVVALAGPALFAYIFGPQWAEAGSFSRWLAAAMFVTLVSEPAVALVPVLRLEKAFLLIELVSLALRVGGLLLGALWMRSDIAAVALFSGATAAGQLLLITWVGVASARAGAPLQEPGSVP